MKKQIIQVTIAFLFALTIMGVTSAADQQVVGTSQDPQQIGTIVAQDAVNTTSGLGMNTSNSNLLITTASTAHQNGQSTEDSVQAVVDTTNTLSTDKQKITYGQGNILTINDPNGPLEFTFISKTGTNLMAKKYSVSETGVITTTKDAYNIGTVQSEEQFQAAIAALGTNGYDIAAIVNLWAQGAPADLLATTYTTGTIDAKTLTNYAIFKQFQQNYPVTVGSDSWQAITSNYVFANAGTSGIDTAIYGEYGFAYYYYAMKTGNFDKLGIMQYNTNTNAGLMAVMKQNDLRNTYGSIVSGTLSELLFNNWIYNNYLKANHINQLYSVSMLKKVDETAFKYLWFDPTSGYGHGLDEAYIAGLPNLSGIFDQSQSVIPVTDFEGMKQLGIEAFNKAATALGYTSTAKFINDIKTGKIGVICLPYYYNVMVNGKSTSLAGFIDGVNYANLFTIHNLMPVSSHIQYGWDTVQALFLHVTQADLNNVSNTVIKSAVISLLNTNPGDSIANWGGVKGMKAAWGQQEPYDYLMTLSRVGCRCSAQDYYSAIWGIGQYPLGANEYYIVMGLDGFSQLDSARTTIFGISPSLGTYLTPGDANDPNAMYILIKWNSMTNIGTAALIYYNSTVQKSIMTKDGYSNSYNWFLDKVLKNPGYLSSVFSVYREIPLTSQDLTAFTAAGGDKVNYIKNFIVPTPIPPAPTPTPTPSQRTSGTGSAISASLTSAWTNAWNGLTSNSGTTSSTNNEIAPGLPLEQTTSTSTSTNNNAGVPMGAILGAIFLVIAGILVYMGRGIIIATIKGSERPGK